MTEQDDYDDDEDLGHRLQRSDPQSRSAEGSEHDHHVTTGLFESSRQFVCSDRELSRERIGS